MWCPYYRFSAELFVRMPCLVLVWPYVAFGWSHTRHGQSKMDLHMVLHSFAFTGIRYLRTSSFHYLKSFFFQSSVTTPFGLSPFRLACFFSIFISALCDWACLLALLFPYYVVCKNMSKMIWLESSDSKQCFGLLLRLLFSAQIFSMSICLSGGIHVCISGRYKVENLHVKTTLIGYSFSLLWKNSFSI